jgi:DGQHR domain-containing protein
MIKMKYVTVEQPIGTLYLGSLSVCEIETFSKVVRREKPSDDGIQRKLDKKRLKAIGLYSENYDSVFPTPVILAGKSNIVEFENDYILINPIVEEIDRFNIVDGQHRFYGIRDYSANGFNYKLPVAIIFNTTLEQEAHIFSVINGNQKPVSKSLIYDLFNHSNKRSMERTGHIIAQELNSDPSSPFFNKLKMLGFLEKAQPNSTKEKIKDYISLIKESNNQLDTYKNIYTFINNLEPDTTTESIIIFLKNNKSASIDEIINYISLDTIPSLSQGIFIDILLEYISNDVRYENLLIQRGYPLEFKTNKKFIFRDFYNKQEDFMIYKILKNYFNAVKKCFLLEWEKSDKYIISKSTGYMALMRLLSDLFSEAEKNNFSESYFESIFYRIKNNLPATVKFTSDQFGSSKSGAAKLYRTIKEYQY